MLSIPSVSAIMSMIHGTEKDIVFYYLGQQVVRDGVVASIFFGLSTVMNL